MIPEKVQRVLDEHNLKALEFEPGSTPTAEAAASRIGVEVCQIAKSILLKAKDGSFRMAVIPGDRKISSSKIKKISGIKHSMASAEDTLKATGYKPGGVCPFAVDGIEVFIDKRLGGYEVIYPAAGTDATGVPMTFEQLRDITGATVGDFCTEK